MKYKSCDITHFFCYFPQWRRMAICLVNTKYFALCIKPCMVA